MLTCLKILGERNSGTTFVQYLLAQNLPVRVLPGGVPRIVYRALPFEFVRDGWFRLTDRMNLGWKHGFPDVEKIRRFSVRRPLVIVCVCKNPYAYLLSLFRNPYHLNVPKGDFLSFLKTPCPVVRREHAECVFRNPIALWNAKNRAFLDLSLSDLPVMLMRYEDVLTDPKAAVERVAERFHLKKSEKFQGVYRSTKRDKVRVFEDFQFYFLKEKWRAELTSDEVAQINFTLDGRLCSELGYAVLNPEEFDRKVFS